jgi:inner membrane protein
MDNVTHSLAGALLAEAWVFFHQRRSGKQASAVFPRAALFISVLGSNLPDADMLYTGLTPSPLGYLLHHRGHTHTLLPIAVVLGALSALAVLGVVRWKWSITRPEAYGIMVLGVLSPIAHIAMDAGNIYGVHPFWPVHDGWFYGDSVFILEPLFWVTALPVLLAQARSRGWRFLLALLLLLGVGLPWLVPGFVPLGLRVLIAALALVVSLVAW